MGFELVLVEYTLSFSIVIPFNLSLILILFIRFWELSFICFFFHDAEFLRCVFFTLPSEVYLFSY